MKNFSDALYKSGISSLPLINSGKVRDIYALDSKLLIVTTDGQPNDADATKRAAALVKEHARIVCIGIGRDVSQTLLMELASSPQDCFLADSASAVGGIFDTIVDLYIKKE